MLTLLDLTLSNAAENLALEEALLDEAERGIGSGSVLRLWEPATPSVVIGRSSRVNEEVRVAECRARGIPILRRCSGGAAIVTGPGCLMYAVILPYAEHPALRILEQAHRFVLGIMARAVSQAIGGLEPIVQSGTSDLAIAHRKFSGNSLRCKRDHLLYHGTILYDFPLDLVTACLGTPPRQPDYRAHREHAAFVTNIAAERNRLRACITEAWQATDKTEKWPRAAVAELVSNRYGQDSWNLRF
jgi:lipoate-protein ligase A